MRRLIGDSTGPADTNRVIGNAARNRIDLETITSYPPPPKTGNAVSVAPAGTVLDTRPGGTADGSLIAPWLNSVSASVSGWLSATFALT